jgi:acid phosphatase
VRSRHLLAGLVLGTLLGTVALTACQTSTTGRATPVSADQRPASAPATSRAGGPTPVTKLLVVVVENHSLREMRGQMPATFALAREYGFATRYRALTHPSLPNYLALAGGSTFGVTDDGPPASHRVHGASVFGQALAAGKSARVYAEGMPGRCALEPGGERYAVKHNPWAYFVDERSTCRRDDVPLDRLAADVAAGDLPNAGLVVPDLCHDAHDPDCDLADADAWLRDEVGTVLAGPDFASGHLAVVITADEDDRSQGNRVLTTVLHPSQHGHVVRTPLTHYSLTGLYDRVLGVRLLRRAAGAPDLARAFGLPLPRR